MLTVLSTARYTYRSQVAPDYTSPNLQASSYALVMTWDDQGQVSDYHGPAGAG